MIRCPLATLASLALLLFVSVTPAAADESAAPAEATEPPAPVAATADDLAAWMCGIFDSSAQAEADTTYFNIRLAVSPIWPDRGDGPWLYVEQAVAARPEAPYRQRVYRVQQLSDDLFQSEIYTLPDPEATIGAAPEAEIWDSVSPEDLELRAGCDVMLRWNGQDRFVGSTIGESCASSLRGASFATSRVTVEDGRLRSWDQGFDAAGEQVWGAEKGPYDFVRVGEAAE